MEFSSNPAPAEPVKAPGHGFGLLIEPEPWLRTFLRNLGDLFRAAPPPTPLASAPGEYWPDALVHRPVAWKSMFESYLGHLLAVGAIYAGSLWWLNQPHVIAEDPPRTATILHYEVSEYLPEVRPKAAQPETPVRPQAQKADPEYSPQRIVSLHVEHNSTRQTIIQPDPNLLRQDVPMPNIVAWTPVPIAPPEATHRRLLDLPAEAPRVVPPPQPATERHALAFPPAARPEVIAPSSPVAANISAPQIPAMNGPVVIPPSQDLAPRDPSRLQLQAQAPPLVVAPPAGMASRTTLAQSLPAGQLEVAPPAQDTGRRSLTAMHLPEQGPVAPPAPPLASGMGQAQAREVGQLLALNARPSPPVGPVSVTAGNRQGEFVAGPEGRVGASATPETKAGNPSLASHPGEAGAGSVSVDAPPVRIAGGPVAAGPRFPPAVALASSASAVSADVPADRIDSQIFGGRKRYSMRLNMPNLSSAMGSWTVRFAELNIGPAGPGDLTAPEAIRKVDPAYPINLMNDRIEGVVVLHAVIHSDGSVGEVRVLEGFYDQLDENARIALEQWRFRPGTKNGVPVDVEAVIRVPFRVRRSAF